MLATDERLRKSALVYLTKGRVTVIDAHGRHWSKRRARAIFAEVRGHQGLYEVDGVGDHWTCTCVKWADDRDHDPHIAAVKMVTGYDTPARS